MKAFAITKDPRPTTINMKIGSSMLFLIDSLNVINIQKNTVPPAAISISVMNVIIAPTPEIMLYLLGFERIDVTPSIEAPQKLFPLKAI